MKANDKKRFTVIGAGVSGMALALFARSLGAEVFVSEEKNAIATDAVEQLKNAGIEWEVKGHTERAFEADALLLSSGIPPFASCVRDAERRRLPIIGELDFVIPHIKGRIVGVTGTNGKSTLTALAGHILQKTGLKVGVGGNIGTAVSLFTEERFDCVVLELSSFQLHWAHDLKSTVAVVSNLAHDHIDWHGTFEAYVAAKAKILSLQDADGWSIIQDRDYKILEVARPQRTVLLSWNERVENEAAGHIFMKDDAAVLRMKGTEERLLFRYSDTSLLGSHNYENTAMALAVAHLLDADVPGAEAKNYLAGFRPLPHRCELAGTVDGVIYVDDSKGTNVTASITAMTSIKGRKVVILGGKGKGENYEALAEAVKREADAAVLIGEEKDRIEIALRNAGFETISKTVDMEEAVSEARRFARPGMVVLLSPACTSWDMYENYKKRGEHFCAIVRSLER